MAKAATKPQTRQADRMDIAKKFIKILTNIPWSTRKLRNKLF